MGAIKPRPLKSHESSARNWERINLVGETAAEARHLASQLYLRQRRQSMAPFEALYPFKIYQPPWETIDGVDWGFFWRTFRVRAGRVMETDATGTDAATDGTPNADPDALHYPTGNVDVRVPASTAKFWFWLEVDTSASPTTAVVRYGPDPTADAYTPAGGDPTAAWTTTRAWSIGPIPDANHIPIGWVDTNTEAENLRSVVRQLLRADVVQVGGGAAAESTRLMTLQSFHFNYLICRPDGGASDGSSDVTVALQPELRDTITTEDIGGETWDYDSYDASDQSRNATYGAITEHQFITPRFLAGARVPVDRCLNTGVKGDGTSGLTVDAAAVAAGGTGYAVSDVLTVLGGTGTAATLTVTSVGGSGTITGVSVTTAGDYTIAPGSPNAVTGGTGFGASMTLTISAALQYICITGREWAKENAA